MTVTQEELNSFRGFVERKMNDGGSDLTLEDCMRAWRAEQERQETIAEINQAVEDIEAGRSYTIEAVDAEIRRRFGLAPHKETA